MWFLPSRGRAHLIGRLWQAGMPTAPGVLAIDEGEERDYTQVVLPPKWRTVILDRYYLSAKVNRLLRMFPREPWYGVICDDQVPQTPGWDQALAEKAGSWRIAWADDCLNRRIGAFVMGGELARALGWIMCPTVKHFFLDDVHETIARDLHCGIFCPEVKIAHWHFSTGKMPFDTTYANRPSHVDDQKAFETWKADEWPAMHKHLSARMIAACSM
jgi:hypothetical protein